MVAINTLPARGEQVTVTITEPLTYRPVTITGTVAGFNYSFEHVTAYFVDTADRGQVVVWL